MNKFVLAFFFFGVPGFGQVGMGHQAFGPIRFGMERKDVEKALGQLSAEVMKRPVHASNAADVRKYFVTSGGMKLPKNAAAEAALTVSVHAYKEPALTSVQVVSHRNPSEEYDTATKEGWQIFKDICDSKFSRVGASGVYPAKDAFSDTVFNIVTDTWETEGVRVELSVQTGTLISAAEKGYNAVLIARPIATISAPPK